MDTTMDRPTLLKPYPRIATCLEPDGTSSSPLGLPSRANLACGQTAWAAPSDWEALLTTADVFDPREVFIVLAAQATVDRAIWVTTEDEIPRSGAVLGTFPQEFTLEVEVVAFEPLTPLIVPEDSYD